MTDRYIMLVNDDDKRLVACGNCDWQGTAETMDRLITNLDKRIAPGEIVPAGECPKCGALAYLAGIDKLAAIDKARRDRDNQR